MKNVTANAGDEEISIPVLKLGDVVTWLNEAGELTKWKVTFLHPSGKGN